GKELPALIGGRKIRVRNVGTEPCSMAARPGVLITRDSVNHYLRAVAASQIVATFNGAIVFQMNGRFSAAVCLRPEVHSVFQRLRMDVETPFGKLAAAAGNRNVPVGCAVDDKPGYRF